MRWSRYYLYTTREVPADAEVVSHQLMVRAGMIKKVAAGIYSYLPLGWRSMQKLEAIVRRALDAAGAVELSMPAVQPAELWQESGALAEIRRELLRIRDRHERVRFGPTRGSGHRHRAPRPQELPSAAGQLYQIQTKFRDEDPAALRADARPRIHDEGRLLLPCLGREPGRDLSRHGGPIAGSSTPAVSTTRRSRPTPATSAARRRTSSW
jgi:hypothetical protein